MTVCTVNHLPAATHGETARCLFAIELSKQSWVIGFITPLSAKINRRILSGGDWRGLLELIGEMRARVSRETGRAVEVISCYEAGYDGFWLHRQLEAHGIRITLLIGKPAGGPAGATSKDGSDRHGAVAAFADGVSARRAEGVERGARASVAEEDARRLHRERDRLVSERVQHVNRIKGLCALQGIDDYHVAPRAMARLEQLRTAQGVALPPRLKSEIKRELHRLELVVEMIASLEAERDIIAEDKASTHIDPRKCRLSIAQGNRPELPRCWLARYSIVTSTIAANWRLCGLRAEPFRAETWRMTKASVKLATQGANHRDRTRLAVAALSADSDLSVWFRARVGTVKGRIRRCHRGVGAQAAGGVMALS